MTAASRGGEEHEGGAVDALGAAGGRGSGQPRRPGVGAEHLAEGGPGEGDGGDGQAEDVGPIEAAEAFAAFEPVVGPKK